jgi:predicted RNA-binding Zn ribbon-like protein
MRTESLADELLLGLLNSTPVVDGVTTDELSDIASSQNWLVDAGGSGSEGELLHVLRARSALQEVVRGKRSSSVLEPLLRGVAYRPSIDGGIKWDLKVERERELAVRLVLAWDSLEKRSPGRLRPCANEECRLFLIDRSTANRARWCSMAVCGNRMKARRHYRREREIGEALPNSGRER